VPGRRHAYTGVRTLSSAHIDVNDRLTARRRDDQHVSMRFDRVRAFLAAFTVAILGLGSASAPTEAAPPAVTEMTTSHSIAFDQYSMIIDGRRTFVWSGEMHPFRLPSPVLWRDVLQKMKAIGFNAVSFYFD